MKPITAKRLTNRKPVSRINCFGALVVFFLLALSIFSTQLVYSQQKFPEQKVSPGLLREIKSGLRMDKSRFIITISGKELPAEIKLLAAEKRKIKEFDNLSFFEIRVSVEELLTTVIFAREVLFIEDASRKPREELSIGNLDLSANKINLIHRLFPQWNGNGTTVSVKENRPDTADIDFKGRYIRTPMESNIVSGHASIMTTMIAGAGNTWHLSKGVAWGTNITSSDFTSLLPDANSYYQQYNISVQNHSYGVGIENFYGADAAAYDATTITNPSLIHVFSSGNSGTSTSTTGKYSGIGGFANLTGSFKMAKNIIVVGATDSFGRVATLTSRGPAHDGRVRPEVVAFGLEGSSGAAALVSGTALLLQQSYKELHGSMPPAALIKSILINSADDVGNKEVDFENGYGSLNAFNALKTLQTEMFMNGNVSQSDKQIFSIAVPAGIKKMKITLAWNDPPALPNATTALVNDLDLGLIHQLSGESWKPWVLNHFPHRDSLKQLPRRLRDSLNNIEQVTIDFPTAGNYNIEVSGFDIPSSSQDFHIAYQFDSSDVFQWTYPTGIDFLSFASSVPIRWNSSFAAASGLLEYSVDDGNTWNIISGNADLNIGYHHWNTPSETSTARLRMTVQGRQFITDQFTLSTRTLTGVGFNCPDSFLIHWNPIQGVNNYRVYTLGSKYLELLTSTTDTFLVLSKKTNPSLHYAVAPLLGNMEGMKSYTFDYTRQGVECYIRSFLSSLIDNNVSLDLSLGTLFGIKRIVLEKFDGIQYQPLQELRPGGNMVINFIDRQLKKGMNIYRVKIELENGAVIYSQPETVYYFSGSEFIVYPNPVKRSQKLTVVADNTIDPILLRVINITGHVMQELNIDGKFTSIQTNGLSKGLYFLQFLRNGKENMVFKIIVH